MPVKRYRITLKSGRIHKLPLSPVQVESITPDDASGVGAADLKLMNGEEVVAWVCGSEIASCILIGPKALRPSNVA